MILTPNQKMLVTLAGGGTLTLASAGGVSSVVRLANPPGSGDPRAVEQFADARSYGPYALLTLWSVACISGTLDIAGDFLDLAVGVADANTVTNFQMRAALKELGRFTDVRDFIAADEEDNAAAQWLSGAPIQAGDTLSTWIAGKLGYGPTDLAALFNLAATKG